MIEPDSDARRVLEFLVDVKKVDGFLNSSEIAFWMGLSIEQVDGALAILKQERLIRVSPASLKTYRFGTGHKRTCEIPETYLANNDGSLVIREMRKDSPFYV